ncbi:MAG: argininosuccinate lyase [Bacteroidales bacterium]|nr:argininosuccinate lyase [Bacteroidales bacterium]
MKLWEKGIRTEPSIIEFTSGSDRETDLLLTRWDIVGSMAHAVMLETVGLLTHNDAHDLLTALQSLMLTDKEKGIKIEPGVEDIHSQIEKELIALIGDKGKKIHTGRSRNDQVQVDIRLYLRHETDRLAYLIKNLFLKLNALSGKYKEVFLPGYTHMQPAMLSSFGQWFGAYSEALADDIHLLAGARKTINRNPLGTAAGYGTTLPLDRKLTTELLGFENMIFNSAYAGLSRGKAELAAASALASVAQTLSRLSMDICLFMTAEYHFIDFPDELVTGSSIMPQKRNPDVFELIRARMNLVQALPVQICMITGNLPSGYNRDLQLLKHLVFDGYSEVGQSVEILLLMLESIKIRENILENPAYNNIYSTEEVNRLVRQGVPFRDAYRQVAEKIKESSFSGTSLSEYTHHGSIGNLCNEEISLYFESAMNEFRIRTPDEYAEEILKRGGVIQKL